MQRRLLSMVLSFVLLIGMNEVVLTDEVMLKEKIG